MATLLLALLVLAARCSAYPEYFAKKHADGCLSHRKASFGGHGAPSG
jgi:hypothetical protein